MSLVMVHKLEGEKYELRLVFSFKIYFSDYDLITPDPGDKFFVYYSLAFSFTFFLSETVLPGQIILFIVKWSLTKITTYLHTCKKKIQNVGTAWYVAECTYFFIQLIMIVPIFKSNMKLYFINNCYQQAWEARSKLISSVVTLITFNFVRTKIGAKCLSDENIKRC